MRCLGRLRGQEPEIESLLSGGQALVRHGFRWRTLRTVFIGLHPVVIEVNLSWHIVKAVAQRWLENDYRKTGYRSPAAFEKQPTKKDSKAA